ncbi:MAG: hypothetical protein KKD00_07305 [Gammaproteobacteria bacterium]|nr:hypothetical protein [Gammaproteobacteria bacterium]
MTKAQVERIKSMSFRLTDIGVHLSNGKEEIMICGPLEVVSRIRINMPVTSPQSWMTLAFTDLHNNSKQILIQDNALNDEHYWALLGDLYQENFHITRGFEETVRNYLIHSLEHTHEFELRDTVPVHSVYLDNDRPGRKSLYEELVSNASH